MTRTRTRVGPQSSKSAPRLDVDALLDDASVGIIVCCGSGGVGKTTISAALALRAAERGRHVVVLTIDPARRLAQSMGIAERTIRVHLQVEGIVQGVGFRPFVYSLARSWRLSGMVGNNSLGAFVELEGSEAAVAGFQRDLRPQAPPLAVIDLALLYLGLRKFHQKAVS